MDECVGWKGKKGVRVDLIDAVGLGLWVGNGAW